MNTTFDEESQPLVARPVTRRRDNSVASFLARGRSNTINSLRSGYETVKKHKNEFWLLIIGSIMLYLGFTLAFLPRTSLSRDFRRLYFGKLTKSEAFRIYIESLMKENKCATHLEKYTTNNHWAGDRVVLDYTVSELSKLGFTPKLEKYHVWLNEPVYTEVTLWDSGILKYNASMVEDDISTSDEETKSVDKVMAFHGYSANGTVQSQYIYSNYGTLEDYEQLQSNNIDTRGKIHIIRYGKDVRGISVKNAEDNGALGVILFTDSFDDGLITEKNGYKPFPHGPARHESSIERGSVLIFSDAPGDPSTPGYPSKKRSGRKNTSDSIPSIPSVPMSQREIAPLLRHLNGKGFEWGNKGNVKGFDYFSGPSEPEIECKVTNHQNYLIKEIANVIVEIPGILKQQEVIIGNHRDAWTTGGAGQPGSGSAILLEIARGFSALHEKGWKPLRTIKLISWDGEEQGMLGSTEYGEDHSDSLQRGTIAYFNLDGGVTGSKLNVKANPLLNELLVLSSKRTLFKEDPETTVYDYWKQSGNVSLEILGAGSDFAVFQNSLGIPSIDFRFERDPTKDAVHPSHSSYDSYEWMQKFVDPDFSLHSTMAAFVGMSILSLTENELIGFKTHEYMVEISKYFKTMYGDISVVFPHDTFIDTLRKNLADLLELLTTHTSIDFDAMVDSIKQQTEQDFPWWKWNKKLEILTRLISANSKLRKLDRYFITERGLKNRPFMKHSIFAPNRITGYEGDVLPGLHEAILSKDRQECIFWLETLITQLDKVVSLLTI